MLKKILTIALPVILALVVAGGGGTYWYVNRALPTTTSELILGVDKPVTVVRDSYGVPHIHAETEHDLMYAQGYVQAQDRLLQMELTRRAVSGRLAEVLGAAQVPSDRFYRVIGFKRAADEAVSQIEQATRDNLQAYADGVNAFLADVKRGAAKYPAEFLVLGLDPEPWTIADSLAVGKLMAWDLGGNMRTELAMSLLVPKLGEERARALLPLALNLEELRLEQPVTAISEQDGTQLLSLLTAARDVGFPGEGIGSNNWVVAGSRTESGKPMLANDMHLSLGAPSILYQQHLVVPGMYDVAGAIFPGVPGVIVGHNQRVSWAFTNGMSDVQDLYIEKQNPDNPHQFEHNGKWVDAKVVQEEIKVKGSESVRFETVITRHGPLINSLLETLKDGERLAAATALKTAENITQPLALKWVAHEYSDEIGAMFKMNKAQNWTEFEKALRQFYAPVQNVVYADVDGNIAYRLNGRIPIRKNGTGLLPVPGWNDEYEWTGYIKWEDLPQSYNPPEGYIATANNRVVDAKYPYLLSQEWEPSYRVDRITEMITEADKLRMSDFQRMQTDWKNLQAEANLKAWLPALAGGEWNETEQLALEQLQAWADNPVDAPDLAGPSIYHSSYLHMMEAAFQPQMGEKLYVNFLRTTLPLNALDAVFQQQDPAWIRGTGQTKEDVIRTGFKKAVAELSERLGDKPAEWAWGEIHTLTLQHPLGMIKPLNLLFNEGPHSYGGSNTTVNMGGFPRTKPYEMMLGAPWRFTVDMANPNAAEDVLIMGASAQLGSDHYADQSELWVRGKYKKLHEPQSDAHDTLIMQPAKGL